MQTSDEVEKDRLQILHQFEILDTENEQELDELTQLAAAICNTPIALISLIDENRQWFKAKFGLEVSQTERSIAFCHHAIKNDNIFEIPDATEDDRFVKNPLVTGNPNIRFYAGSPLITSEGYKLGTLCVIDRIPKQLSPEQKNILALLSKQVINSFELRLSRKELRQDKRNLEDIVRQKISEFKTLAENSTDIIFRLNKDLKIIFINKTFFPDLHSSSNYFGKSAAEIGMPEEIIRLTSSNAQKINFTSGPLTDYIELPGRSGTTFNFAYITTVAESNKEGEITSYLFLVRDISDIKLNEQKLILANKELDRFVYSASHELRAPLKSILGLTSIARNDFNAQNFKFHENYLSGIEGSIKRLDSLVKNIIDYSRNTRLELNGTGINFQELINNILLDLSFLNKLDIKTNLHIDAREVFKSDLMRIGIICTNLISNAIKYSDPAKKENEIGITIETFTEKCTIVISDNGVGIDAAYLDKICNMFFRATNISDGAGLGLYIVKETVERLKGTIKIKSVLEEGTTVEVELPNEA